MDDEGREAASAQAPPPHAGRAMEEFLAVRCNFPLEDGKVCGKDVTALGWCTSCAHIFCEAHARHHFEHDNRCPICLDEIGDVRIRKVGVSVAAQNTSPCTQLVGRSPLDAQAAVSPCISFWMEQKFSEFKRQVNAEREQDDRLRHLLDSSRRRLQEADTLRAKQRVINQELERQLQKAEQERKANHQEMRQLEVALEQSTRRWQDAAVRAMGVTPGRGQTPRKAHAPSPSPLQVGQSSSWRPAGSSASRLVHPSRSPRRSPSLLIGRRDFVRTGGF